MFFKNWYDVADNIWFNNIHYEVKWFLKLYSYWNTLQLAEIKFVRPWLQVCNSNTCLFSYLLVGHFTEVNWKFVFAGCACDSVSMGKLSEVCYAVALY